MTMTYPRWNPPALTAVGGLLACAAAALLVAGCAANGTATAIKSAEPQRTAAFWPQDPDEPRI